VTFVREQAQNCLEKHRGDGLAPLLVEACDEIDLLKARLAHALQYVSDDDQALATTLPPPPPTEDEQADPDEDQAPDGDVFEDDEETAVRKASDEDA
jgi:hypothetical protein